MIPYDSNDSSVSAKSLSLFDYNLTCIRSLSNRLTFKEIFHFKEI